MLYLTAKSHWGIFNSKNMYNASSTRFPRSTNRSWKGPSFLITILSHWKIFSSRSVRIFSWGSEVFRGWCVILSSVQWPACQDYHLANSFSINSAKCSWFQRVQVSFLPAIPHAVYGIEPIGAPNILVSRYIRCILCVILWTLSVIIPNIVRIIHTRPEMRALPGESSKSTRSFEIRLVGSTFRRWNYVPWALVMKNEIRAGHSWGHTSDHRFSFRLGK